MIIYVVITYNSKKKKSEYKVFNNRSEAIKLYWKLVREEGLYTYIVTQLIIREDLEITFEEIKKEFEKGKYNTNPELVASWTTIISNGKTDLWVNDYIKYQS